MSAEVAAKPTPDSQADQDAEGRITWGKSRADQATRLIHDTPRAEPRGPPPAP
jgi:hypothetical protein